MVLGTVIALYLLGLASEVALGISAMAGVLIGLLAWAWAYPSLEVAPQGDTRIWRMAKYLGAVLGGLIATAIGKALFQ